MHHRWKCLEGPASHSLDLIRCWFISPSLALMLGVGGWVYACVGRGYCVREWEFCVFHRFVFVCLWGKQTFGMKRVIFQCVLVHRSQLDTGTPSFHISSVWTHLTGGVKQINKRSHARSHTLKLLNIPQPKCFIIMTSTRSVLVHHYPFSKFLFCLAVICSNPQWAYYCPGKVLRAAREGRILEGCRMFFAPRISEK